MTKIEEIWKEVVGYEDYMVSCLGRVKSLPKQVWGGKVFYTTEERILKQIPNDNGYLRVFLYKNKKSKTFYVHRLVMTCFHGEPSKGIEINHIDGDKVNNKLSNLEFCTSSENKQHAIKNGLTSIIGETNHLSKLKKEDVLRIRSLKGKMKIKELANEYGVSQSSISLIQNRKNWKHI